MTEFAIKTTLKNHSLLLNLILLLSHTELLKRGWMGLECFYTTVVLRLRKDLLQPDTLAISKHKKQA